MHDLGKKRITKDNPNPIISHMERKLKHNLVWVVVLLAATLLILVNHNRPAPYQKDSGLVFGTVYNITYQHKENLKAEIEQELRRFDGSLSPFNDTATITRVNRNEAVAADTFFTRVFQRSMEISQETGGAFDITVAPLVNAWGFGFREGTFPDSARVDSLLQFVGYRKVTLTDEGRIVKQDSRLMLDCSAVAKGYAVDVVARLLISKGVQNFMVDIGGEVVVGGHNPQGTRWRIGINKPVDDSLSLNRDLQTVLHVSGVGIATSGNYRNYYYRDGKKYAHTIDPRTGYPVQHSILSATVIARDCMSADAYATAFMVMGLDEAVLFVEARPDLYAYFIHADGEGKTAVYQTQGMERYLSEAPSTASASRE